MCSYLVVLVTLWYISNIRDLGAIVTLSLPPPPHTHAHMSPPSPPSLYPPFLVQEGVPDAPGGADYDMEVDEEARGAAGADATAATARAAEAGGSRDPAALTSF